jgi:Polyketide cyclase / dehydrase and lipid transport
MSRRRRVVRIEVKHRFDVSIDEGFDYITEPENWPAYWPRFVRLDRESGWRAPGDRARVTLRMLAREVDLDMTLARFERCRVVDYTSEQRGLPAARHWRYFQETDGGFTYRIVIEYVPRAGWSGLLDRTLVRHAVTDTARATMRNLEGRFRERSQPTDGAAGIARAGGQR